MSRNKICKCISLFLPYIVSGRESCDFEICLCPAVTVHESLSFVNAVQKHFYHTYLYTAVRVKLLEFSCLVKCFTLLVNSFPLTGIDV